MEANTKLSKPAIYRLAKVGCKEAKTVALNENLLVGLHLTNGGHYLNITAHHGNYLEALNCIYLTGPFKFAEWSVRPITLQISKTFQNAFDGLQSRLANEFQVADLGCRELTYKNATTQSR